MGKKITELSLQCRSVIGVIARASIVLLGLFLVTGAAAGSERSKSFVPQLELTDLFPAKIAVAPNEPKVLLVVNLNGRLDVFDLTSGRLIKIAEIEAGIRDAVFIAGPSTSRDDTRIVAGAGDGTIRVWTLDGKPTGPTIRGHRGAVRTVAAAANGKLIASGGDDGTIRLWSLDGEPIAALLDAHAGGVSRVSFSPDGQQVVSSGGDGAVRFWTLAGKAARAPIEGRSTRDVAVSRDGKRVVSTGVAGEVFLAGIDEPLPTPAFVDAGAVESIAFSPDGRLIATGGRDRTVRLWTRDGRPVAEPFRGHTGWVSTVAFSGDGTRIFSGSNDGSVRVWMLDARPALERFWSRQIYVGVVAFSPNGKIFASGGNDLGTGTIQLWSPDGKPAGPPIETRARVTALSFSHDGTKIVSGNEDGTIRWWTLDGKPMVDSIPAHSDAVASVGFTADDSRIISGSLDGIVRLWAQDGRPAAAPIKDHEGQVTGLAFSPDGSRVVSGDKKGMIRLWAIDGTLAAQSFKAHDSSVLSIAFSPDGTRIASGGEDAMVRIWTADGTPAAEPIKGHDGPVRSVAFSPNANFIVSAGEDVTVRLWTPDGKPAADPLVGHDGPLSSVAFSADGTHIVSSAMGGDLRVWTIIGKAAAEPFAGQSHAPDTLAVSPDGRRIVTGHSDGTVRFWMLNDAIAFKSFKGHESSVTSLAFSPDGLRVASGDNTGIVRIWTLDGGTTVGPFKAHASAITSLAFSPDGSRIVSSAFDQTMKLWMSDGQPVAQPFNAVGIMKSVVFSPDGRRIVAGGSARTVYVWTLDGSAPPASFSVLSGEVARVAVSPDGKRIASVGADGTVQSWLLDAKPETIKADNMRPLDFLGGGASALVFSPDGKRLIVGGRDNGVWAWDTQTHQGSYVMTCAAERGVGFVKQRFVWVGCRDRISFWDFALTRPRGEMFLTDLGIIPSVTQEGVYFASDRLSESYRSVANNGVIDWNRHSVPEISLGRARQALLDQWTWTGRVLELARRVYQEGTQKYNDLGWLKAAFWPALGWFIAVLVAITTWIFAPRKLAEWAMRDAGTFDISSWKWLASVLTLFDFLGKTRRPVLAWLQFNRELLYAQNFSGRDPVKERKRYCDLDHEDVIAAFKVALLSTKGARVWITGVNGAGKSALAFKMLRTATKGGRAPLPVLIDEDWDGALLDHVVRLLRINGKGPLPVMVELLGRSGDICVLIDSLSERGMDDAAKRVADAAAAGKFKSLMITSRKARPEGQSWETFKSIVALPITSAQVPDYIATYAPEDRRAGIAKALGPLIAGQEQLSPLFLRFAIEQALIGEVTSTNTLKLVLQYVEALRAGRLDLGADDMLRAAAIASVEATRETLVPREMEYEFLRGVLVKEADTVPFLNAKSDKSVDPSKIIDMFVECGLLIRNRSNRRLQFAYDPVAEQLAAWTAAKNRDDERLSKLRNRILAVPESAIAHALVEIEHVPSDGFGRPR